MRMILNASTIIIVAFPKNSEGRRLKRMGLMLWWCLSEVEGVLVFSEGDGVK